MQGNRKYIYRIDFFAHLAVMIHCFNLCSQWP